MIMMIGVPGAFWKIIAAIILISIIIASTNARPSNLSEQRSNSDFSGDSFNGLVLGQMSINVQDPRQVQPPAAEAGKIMRAEAGALKGRDDRSSELVRRNDELVIQEPGPLTAGNRSFTDDVLGTEYEKGGINHINSNSSTKSDTVPKSGSSSTHRASLGTLFVLFLCLCALNLMQLLFLSHF